MEDMDFVGTVAEGAAESGAFDAESIDGNFLNGFFAEELAMQDAGADAEEPVLFDEAADRAESDAPEGENGAEKVGFVEHGQKYFVEKDALARFAEAVGKKPEEVIDLYQKGCGFESLNRRLEASQKDSALIESYRASRDLSEEDARAELSELCRRLPLRKRAAELKEQSPGLSDAEAERIASLERESADRENRAQDRFREEKAREIESFSAAHPEITSLSNEIVEAFDSGVPLEEAYRSWALQKQVETLQKELCEAKLGKTKAEQIGYAKQHSAGSAKSAAGTVPKDPFLEGLFGN